ncbi:hypothetical protein CY34DRAFT_237513 [Suillus luteus UH-Slu-Lm8-n1]|uniref:Fungal-type protein kinase domain-containing protein n=1 Tax=Suillus luteus UH-Slu-Lm8-n1 TaxID=930992 RepID=A0A0D0AGW4_9AGAM|nr:hypothetical protein CY34DRAFT_237513 [Suillus luteus UH-Slu-Lm8-n1]
MEMSKRMFKRVAIAHPIDPTQDAGGCLLDTSETVKQSCFNAVWITVSGFVLEVVPEKTDSPPQGIGTHFKRVGIWNQQNWEDFAAYSSGSPEEYAEVTLLAQRTPSKGTPNSTVVDYVCSMRFPHHDPTNELVAKRLYWPEEERESEILQKVYGIAEKDTKGQAKYHVPEMIWSHNSKDTSTANIRRTLGHKDAERGRRVLSIIVFRKLDPITNLSEDEFLSVWWQIILCHYALWQKQVHHCDISPSSLMVYKTSDGRYIGVLNDFDLSSTQDTPSDQERTGTVPFMAVELLAKNAIEGKRLYQNDAESFIWVFAWVCLRYEGGRLLRKGRLLDEWLKLDAIRCRSEKAGFLMEHRHDMIPSQSHKKNWDIAQFCLDALGSYYSLRPSLRAKLEDHVIFKTWLEDHIHNPERLSPKLLDVRV